MALAPESMRDPDHFQPMFRPRGPQGRIGISALDGENWAVFSQSKYPNEAFEFLKLFFKKEHYMKYCHSVPIHLTPILPCGPRGRNIGWKWSGSRMVSGA